MNKYFISLTFATITLACSLHANDNPFAKLTPHIIKNATQWVYEHVSLLSIDSQLSYLNLFAFNTPQSTRQLMQCTQFIESCQEMLPSFEALSISIMDILKKYIEPIHKKIQAKKEKKQLSAQEEETIINKLNTKMEELFTIINTTYYQTLYSHIAQNSADRLAYMFDDNGVIAVEKRTIKLPESV